MLKHLCSESRAYTAEGDAVISDSIIPTFWKFDCAWSDVTYTGTTQLLYGLRQSARDSQVMMSLNIAIIKLFLNFNIWNMILLANSYWTDQLEGSTSSIIQGVDIQDIAYKS